MREMGVSSVRELPADTYALRPIRVAGEALTVYEAVTFANDPRAEIGMWLRRLLWDARDDGSGYQLDILNEDGDIVADCPVTKQGFEYLRSRLHFRVTERQEEG